MDVQSTARIKSFYSAYEKLLGDCLNHYKNRTPIPEHELINDIIATRDVLYPRYQLKNEPQTFYKLVYKTVLDYMEYIDTLNNGDSKIRF